MSDWEETEDGRWRRWSAAVGDVVSMQFWIAVFSSLIFGVVALVGWLFFR